MTTDPCWSCGGDLAPFCHGDPPDVIDGQGDILEELEVVDKDGFAAPGTYPISVVTVGMWKADGTPTPSVESAICDICGTWASELWASGYASCRDDSLTDIRTSRTLTVIVYACPEHSEQVAGQLTDEYGHASNMHDICQALASEVARHRQAYE